MILITGMGGICAAGSDVSEIASAFSRGERRGGPLTRFSSPLEHPVFQVAEIPFRWHRPEQRTLSLALTAVAEAIRDAGLPTDLSAFRVGVCLGTTVASHLNDVTFYRQVREQTHPPLNAVDRYLQGNLAEAVGQVFSCRGPRTCVVNACSSGADAIGVAASWLQAGVCDLAIAGGAEELNRVPYSGFAALGIMSATLCMPYDGNRSGLNLGEGAGIVILEREELARPDRAEGALVLAGYGCSGDAYHMTAPRPDGSGLEEALHQAMAQAGLEAKDIAFINAHGTATRDNDLVEGTTLARVFGTQTPISCTKGYTGHTLGAAGGLEAVFTAYALRHGWIPKSAGFEVADDDIPVHPVNQKTPIHGDFAVSTSLAFGGTNSALVIGRRSHAPAPLRSP